MRCTRACGSSAAALPVRDRRFISRKARTNRVDYWPCVDKASSVRAICMLASRRASLVSPFRQVSWIQYSPSPASWLRARGGVRTPSVGDAVEPALAPDSCHVHVTVVPFLGTTAAGCHPRGLWEGTGGRGRVLVCVLSYVRSVAVLCMPRQSYMSYDRSLGLPALASAPPAGGASSRHIV